MGTKRILAGLMLFFFLFSFLGAEKIRDYLATGSWYPASKTELNSLLSVFFEKAEKINISGTIRGIVAPHAGFSYSGQCAARVYKQFQEQSSKINRIIILGSSHHSGFYGACVSNFTHNATPLGNIPLDRSIMEKLSRESHFQVNNRVMQYEHSIENQLPFLQMIFKDRAIKIVPILFGQLDRKDFSRMANIIRQFVNSKTLVVASTDLNHYGRTFDYTPFTTNIKQNLTRLDQGMIKHITDLDFKGYLDYKQKTGITMCGFVPVGVLMNIFSKKHHRGYLIDYCKSGDRNNDYSLSVSYASLVISEKNPGHSGGSTGNESSRDFELTMKEKKSLLGIARQTLHHYYSNGDSILDVESKYPLIGRLKRITGVFVTLKKGRQLRGCIGTIIGRKPLYQGVMDNVINAAVKDPRFSPVTRSELDKLKIEISVMTPLEKVADYTRIRLGIDGVIINKGVFQSVYLPQVATETGWNLNEFLEHLCVKAGLNPKAYQSDTLDFYVFQAQVFCE